MDNDAYGHVNNVVYYSYFDTVVNAYLIGQGALDIAKSPVIGLVVEIALQLFFRARLPRPGPRRFAGGASRHEQRAL